MDNHPQWETDRPNQYQFQSQSNAGEEASGDHAIAQSGMGSSDYYSELIHYLLAEPVNEISEPRLDTEIQHQQHENLRTFEPSQTLAINQTDQAPSTFNIPVNRSFGGLSELEKKQRKREVDRAYRQRQKESKAELKSLVEELKSREEEWKSRVEELTRDTKRWKQKFVSTNQKWKGEKQENDELRHQLSKSKEELQLLSKENESLRNQILSDEKQENSRLTQGLRIIVKLPTDGLECRSEAMRAAFGLQGVLSAALKGHDKSQIEIIGDGVDPVALLNLLRVGVGFTELVSMSPVLEEKKDKPKKNTPPTPLTLSTHNNGYRGPIANSTRGNKSGGFKPQEPPNLGVLSQSLPKSSNPAGDCGYEIPYMYGGYGGYGHPGNGSSGFEYRGYGHPGNGSSGFEYESSYMFQVSYDESTSCSIM